MEVLLNIVSRNAPGASSLRRLMRRLFILSFTAGACTGEVDDVAGPSTTSQDLLPSIGVSTPQTAGNQSMCDLAVRISPSKYRIQRSQIVLPQSMRVTSDNVVELAFVAWGSDQDGPTRVTVCSVPNVPATIAHVTEAFSKGSAPVTANFREWAGGRRSLARAGEKGRVYFDFSDDGCRANSLVDYGCSCAKDECAGWRTSEVESGEASMPGEMSMLSGEEGELAFSSIEDPDPIPFPIFPTDTIYCNYNLRWLHTSTFPTTQGLISVEGYSACDAPIYKELDVFLQLQSCIPFYCWWTTQTKWEPPAFDLGTDLTIQAKHKAYCKLGWWRGVSIHKFDFPFGYTPNIVIDTIRGIPREATWCSPL